jgi:hypothetical protein
MLKKMLVTLSLSIAFAGPAVAHEGGDPRPAGVVPPSHEEEPGPSFVPGPPPVETPQAKAEVEYRLGVTGFVRGEGAGNFRVSDFSYEPKQSEGRFLYRVKPYAFWHPTDFIDLHVEGQGYGFTGGGHDDWQLSLYQAYFEVKLPDSDLLALKGGRQEFSYGSNFMLGPDAFYNGLSFDAARLRIQPASSLSIDLLGGYYTGPQADGVQGNLSGAYATWTISDGNGVEGYFLRDTGTTDPLAGQTVNSFGVRGTVKLGMVSLEVEPVYQSGHAFNAGRGGSDRISAFGGHADATAQFDVAGLSHKLWLGYAGGSGSREAADGGSTRYQFRNPNNDTAIVGDMNTFGDLSGVDVAGHHASGLQIYTLGWGVDITKQLNLSATVHHYSAVAVESGFSRNLGSEADFTLTYNIADNYTLLLGYDHLFTGSFFRNASGSSVDGHYGYAMLQFNLEKSRLKAPKKGV